jgi:hypothetical protein
LILLTLIGGLGILGAYKRSVWRYAEVLLSPHCRIGLYLVLIRVFGHEFELHVYNSYLRM